MKPILPMLLLIAASGVAHGQVLAPAARSQRLDAVESGSSASAWTPDADLAVYGDPFRLVIAPKAAPTQQTRAVANVPLDDHQALNAIAISFRPRGSLILGDKRRLVLPDSTIGVGETFSAFIQDREYSVRVVEITSAGYVLRLGTATLARTFDESGREATPSAMPTP